VIALGFRLNLTRLAPDPEAAARPERTAVQSVSRAEHLAEQLRRDSASVFTRSGVTASAARAMRSDPSFTPTTRIGDAGRRPAITREALR
jgi:hypothetical protein